MAIDFLEVMEQRTDEELIAILTARKEDYTEPALTAAKIEFDKRRIPGGIVQKIEEKQMKRKETEISRAAEPLEKDVKIVALLVPSLARALYKKKFAEGGYEKKLAEMQRVFWIHRIVFWGALLLL